MGRARTEEVRSMAGPATAAGKPTELTRRLAGLVTAAPGRPMRTSYAPVDGAPIGEVPVCTPDDVVEAVRGARAAQAEWAALSVRERSRVFLRFHDLVLDRQDEIIDLIQLGSPARPASTRSRRSPTSR